MIYSQILCSRKGIRVINTKDYGIRLWWWYCSCCYCHRF